MSGQQGKKMIGGFRQLGGDADWWRSAVIYQVYPRSYLDTNGDGIGDLAGIEQRLDYLAWLGVDAVWVSPFFTSPMKDFGYDVSDYCGIDPMFGTHEDFDRLLEKAHALGIRVLIDLVLSHTSDQHEWFRESRQSRDNAKADWYVWVDPQPDGSPPNNWFSIFGGSAWAWESGRQQYYLHNFLDSQPDLNYHNPEVQTAILDVVRFWLDKGVDGFRLDTVNMYFHDAELRSNPPLPEGMTVYGVDANNPFAMQQPLYNLSRPENVVFIERLRAVLDEYPAVTSVGEMSALTDTWQTISEYTGRGQRLHMAYGFDFMTPTYSAAHIRSIVEQMQQRIGDGRACWAFSNHDVVRVVSRWGLEPEAAPMLVALLTCLGGTACMYQGEELGLPEAEIAFEDLQDPFGIRFWPGFKGRDGCRTPMPWTADDALGGFSDAEKSWLPVAEAHLARAVMEQKEQDGSVLQRVRDFLHGRKQYPALLQGETHFVEAGENVLAFTRRVEEQEVLCVFQLTGETGQFVAPFEVEPLVLALSGCEWRGAECELEGYGFGFAVIER